MLFNSQIFIFGFLPVVLGVYYYFAECRTCRQITVILASLVFYGYWDVRFVALLAGLTVANWLIVRLFERYRHIWILDLGIAMNLGTLAVFKYANFLADNFSAVTGIPHDHWGIVVPLGISFFVFQKISYLADLQHGDPRIYGFLDFCMFVLFFPQLIAGPIVRHNEIISQFEASPRGPTMWENLSRGRVLFLCGLIKKVAIADAVAKISDPLFAKPAHDMLSATEAWTAARAVLVGIDVVWCTTDDRFEKYTLQPFPEWMYRDSLWPAYFEMFNYYTIEQAAKQFMVIAGLRPSRYGPDCIASAIRDFAD